MHIRRREFLLHSAIGLAAFQAGLLAGPPARAGDATTDPAGFDDSQQKRLIDTYWEDLGNDEDAIWTQYQVAAAALGQQLGAAPEQVQ